MLLSDFYSQYNSSFFSIEMPRYYPDSNKIIYVNDYDYKIDFWNTKPILDIEMAKLNKEYSCYSKKTYWEYYTCNEEYNKKYIDIQKKYLGNKELVGMDSASYYNPLTKATALDYIFSQVDFSLFDEKLKVKKETTIDETTTNSQY